MVPVRAWERSSSEVLSQCRHFDRPVASHQAKKVLDAGVLLGEVGHVEPVLDADSDIVEGR